jgi:hypothetical protein
MPATVATVEFDWDRGLQLRIEPIRSVEFARAEFGRTLADARAFVLDVDCNACGTAASVTQPCADCGIPTCSCNTDSHDETVWFCPGCTRLACTNRCCQPD